MELYVTTENADDYHELRGVATWAAADDADKLTALYRAQTWLDSLEYYGSRTDADQEEAWPRKDAVDRIDKRDIPDDEIPFKVKRALYEAALVELINPGNLQPEQQRGGRILSEAVTGAVSVRYEYGAPVGTRYTAIQNQLSGLVVNFGAGVVKIQLG